MPVAQPTLPNLLIIGAAKAGTTSLHNYLSLHPQIHMSKRKELAFFDTRLRWNKGVDWYKLNFDARYPVNGEASPQYALHPRIAGVPQRIKDVLGTPKFIYIVRDPVDRILSNFTQAIDLWPATRPFQVSTIECDHNLYLYGSSYYAQLSEYMKFFPREFFLVVLLERLSANPKAVLQEIFRFVGVDDTFWSDDFGQRFNLGDGKRHTAPWFDAAAPAGLKSQLTKRTWMPWRAQKTLRKLSRMGGESIRKPKISPAEDEKLQALLKDDVAALRAFLGDPLTEWRAYA